MAYEAAFIDNLRYNQDLDRWEMLVRWAGFEQSESPDRLTIILHLAMQLLQVSSM
jgi:hypothetical protein